MKITNLFGTLVISIIFSSCTVDIDLETFIDMSAPFELTIITLNSKTGFTESEKINLDVNSDKWNKLIEWGEKNKENWTSAAPATYIGNIYVIQDNFRLIHTRGSKSVILAFTDTKGNSKQLSKKIDEGDLKFLYAE